MGRFNILTSLFGFHAGTSRQAWSSSCALIEKATNQEKRTHVALTKLAESAVNVAADAA